MLFALTGHALFAASLHIHAGRGRLASARQDDTGRVEGRRDARETNKGVAHAQCLLCRLQRDLVSGLRHGVPQVSAPHALSTRLARRTEQFVPSAAPLSPTGRAPPSLI